MAHESDMQNKVYFWALTVLVLGLVFGVPNWGSKIPGAFFERSDYQGMFYVNLFPDGQKVKSYRVPAVIRATIVEEGRGDDCYSWREYRIEFAAMPNGEKVTFDNADEYLELKTIVPLYDDNGRCWGVELTDQPAR